MKVYVLYDISENSISSIALGLFDHTDISDDELKSYFGEFKLIKFIDIRDSGVEWEMWLNTRDEEIIRLQLYEYEINQIG